MTDHAAAHRLAALFSIHVRTLYRRLTEHGTGYQQLLDETRFEVAMQILQHASRNVAEITPLLGYAVSNDILRRSALSPETIAHLERKQACSARHYVRV